MKQNITTDQLNELTEKGKEKLRKWWIPYYGNEVLCENSTWTCLLGTNSYKHYFPAILLEYAKCNSDQCHHQEIRKNKKDHLPLLSIGQMIEFLDQNILDDILAPNMVGECEGFIEKEQLCDSLWESVKEVLEKS